MESKDDLAANIEQRKKEFFAKVRKMDVEVDQQDSTLRNDQDQIAVETPVNPMSHIVVHANDLRFIKYKQPQPQPQP